MVRSNLCLKMMSRIRALDHADLDWSLIFSCELWPTSHPGSHPGSPSDTASSSLTGAVSTELRLAMSPATLQ